MLGAHFQYLRERAGLSRLALAIRSGLTEADLARVETGEVARMSGRQLLAVSTGLGLKYAGDFARLVELGEHSHARD